MRDGRDVGDGGDLQARGLERADRLLAARARAFDEDLDLAHAVLHRLARGQLGGLGGRIRRALARALEPDQPGAAPAITPPVGSVMVTIVLLNVAWMWRVPDGTFFFSRFFERVAFFRSAMVLPVLYFLRRMPTVRREPRRWRAFVFVRWPRTGRLRRWRTPR